MIIYIITLGLALSIDTFVLSLSLGFAYRSTNLLPYFSSALTFAVVQAGLFAIGRLILYIVFSGNIDIGINLHISFFVFLILGLKMLFEFFQGDEEGSFSFDGLWKISILTSIDALIIGMTPLVENTSNLLMIISIFIFTFIAASIGLRMATKFKKIALIEKYSLLLGAILLLILAINSY